MARQFAVLSIQIGIVAAAELNPCIAQPFVVASHQQIPLHAFGRICIGFHPACCKLTIKEKGQLESHYAAFTRAVVAAKNQVAIFVPKLFVVVEVEIQQTAANWLPTVACHQRQPSAYLLVEEKK
ncbi:MAG: hypothetical protein WD894_02105 [Pirellulales bacterium]